jgi:hypothetical protein
MSLEIMIARSSIARVSSQAVARRQMSAKVHSKEGWNELLKTRPPKDHGDEHVSLEYINTRIFVLGLLNSLSNQNCPFSIISYAFNLILLP